MNILTTYKILLAFMLLGCSLAFAQEQEFTVSPKEGWPDLSEMPEEQESNLFTDILLYIPNKLLDVLDIIKIDLGVGPAAGAIVRVSEHAQVGASVMLPASLRVGLLGRRLPVMLESDGEFALGPSDTDRSVCAAEIGAGADLLLAGAYIGVCPDELIDFISGIFFLDIKDDDLS